MRFKVISTSYNASRWIERSLHSIDSQQEVDFDVCVVDDASTDGADSFIKDFCTDRGWNYILHKKNTGPMCSQYEAVQALDCQKDDVLVWVDGDDRLAHNFAFKRVKQEYDSGALMTYGSYMSEPFSPTCSPAKPYPDDVVKANSYKASAYTCGILFNHLRTVSYRLFERLNPDVDFKYPDGRWLEAAADSAIMLPCLQLAGGRYSFIRDILYCYNSENNISEWRIHPRTVDRSIEYVCKQAPNKRPIIF
jgi:glycosyltransferase involved in cell wall biosynthesis